MSTWKEINPPKKYTDAELLRMGKQSLAQRRLKQAVKNGTIVKSESCQVCGRECNTWAHHWKGYDYPFDVWWVCPRCNANIPWHDGSKSLDEVIQFIGNKFSVKPPFIHRRGIWCDVCDAYSKVGRFIPLAIKESLYLCQYCYENLAGD